MALNRSYTNKTVMYAADRIKAAGHSINSDELMAIARKYGMKNTPKWFAELAADLTHREIVGENRRGEPTRAVYSCIFKLRKTQPAPQPVPVPAPKVAPKSANHSEIKIPLAVYEDLPF